MTKRVEVKIAVAVDANGIWNATGWGDKSNNNSREAMELVVEAYDVGNVAEYWITANLDIPEEIIVPADGVEKK